MTTTTLLSKTVEYGELQVFRIPDDALTPEGIDAITFFLGYLQPIRDWRHSSKFNMALYDIFSFRVIFPADWKWTWMVKGKGEYVGTLPKRISKYIYREFGVSLAASEVQHLGVLAMNAVMSRDEHRFDFVNVFDWKAGDFGEHSYSCWWDGNNPYKDRFEQHGGQSIRFYHPDGTGFARAWLDNIDNEYLIVFNGYGMESSSGATLPIARILATWLGLSYKKISIHNEQLYINNEQGYAIGPVEVLENLYSFDYEWEDECPHCEVCEEAITDHDDDRVYDGYHYCESCYWEKFSECDHCGAAFESENVPTAIGKYGEASYCERCIENRTARCFECGMNYIHSRISVIDDYDICDECAEEAVRFCSICEDEHLTRNMHDSGICEECYEQKKAQEQV